MRSAVLLLAALLSSLGAAASEPTGCKLVRIAEWKVRSTESFSPIIDGEINGKKVGILIDTGAASSILSRSGAIRLGLDRVEATGVRFFGVGGETRAEMTTLAELKIGSSTTRNLRVLVVGERPLGSADLFLGDDFLHAVDIEFDIPNGAIRLFQPKDCQKSALAYWSKSGSGVLPMEGDRRIRFRLELNGKSMSAMLDSGATLTTVTTPAARRAGVTSESPGVVAAGCLTGLGGAAIEAHVGTFETFTIGDQVIRNANLSFGDFWRHTTTSEIGTRLGQKVGDQEEVLLGYDFLRSHRVYVANSQRRVYFTHEGGEVFRKPGPPRPCEEARKQAPRI